MTCSGGNDCPGCGIKSARKAGRMSQGRLGDSLGLSGRQVRNIEAHRADPRPSILLAMIALHGMARREGEDDSAYLRRLARRLLRIALKRARSRVSSRA